MRKSLNYLAIISALFLSFNTVQENKTIIFFGDSLTAGMGLSKEQAFPAVIRSQLVEKGKEINIINAGLSGETSAGGLSRVDWILKKPVDIFVLELGANDALRGLPLTQTIENLQNIINRVKVKYPDVQIVIAGMMAPPNLGKEYADQFREIFPTLAKKNNLILIPFILENVAGYENLNLPDGIHPNIEGHKIVAFNVLKAIGHIL